MHGMHARLPKNFVLEERLERYADAIELAPSTWAGSWAHAAYPLDARDARACYDEVWLDLGCGKGAYLCEAAKRSPHALFVGVDGEPLCVAYTAQHIQQADLRNALVIPGLGSQVVDMFAEGELAGITLNFPTPFPRKKEATGRLTSYERLLDYRRVLAKGARLHLRTDSLPLYRYSLYQLERAGYQVVWASMDARGERPDAPMTEYEARLTAQGARVFAACAVPAGEPLGPGDASPSLVDWLPDDLDELDYVPLGMRGTVYNLRNRRARAWARGGHAEP